MIPQNLKKIERTIRYPKGEVSGLSKAKSA